MKECICCKSTDIECFVGTRNQKIYICKECNKKLRLYPEQMWHHVDDEDAFDKRLDAWKTKID